MSLREPKTWVGEAIATAIGIGLLIILGVLKPFSRRAREAFDTTAGGYALKD